MCRAQRKQTLSFHIEMRARAREPEAEAPAGDFQFYGCKRTHCGLREYATPPPSPNPPH